MMKRGSQEHYERMLAGRIKAQKRRQRRAIRKISEYENWLTMDADAHHAYAINPNEETLQYKQYIARLIPEIPTDQDYKIAGKARVNE